jgi:hypothetical protein
MSGEGYAESNLDDLTDAEIYAAIRYLDPQVRAGHDDSAASAICAAILVLVVAWLGFIWLFPE